MSYRLYQNLGQIDHNLHSHVFDDVIYQGDHIFEQLNSLSFPGYFKLFPDQLKREKIDECIFVGSHVTYFSFSLSFPGFFYKSSSFPE